MNTMVHTTLCALAITLSAGSLPCQAQTSPIVTPLKVWSFVPGQTLSVGPNAAYEINVEKNLSSSVTTIQDDPANSSSRKFLRVELKRGTDPAQTDDYNPYRVECEWYNSNASPRFYSHDVDDAGNNNLWVGFRLRVSSPGANSWVSLFQFGPVRDQDYLTKSVGYYQLGIGRDNASSAPQWWVKKFNAVPEWNDPSNPGSTALGQELGIGRNRNITAGTYRLNIGSADVLNTTTFDQTRFEEWVARLQMSTNGNGRLTLWNGGKKIIDWTGLSNAFANDFTRVKWGTYIGAGNVPAVPIAADYVHLVIAEGGEDGFRAVAPAQYKVYHTATGETVPLISGATSVTVDTQHLPVDWSYAPTTRKLTCSSSSSVPGARILITYYSGTTELKREVWAFSGSQ